MPATGSTKLKVTLKLKRQLSVILAVSGKIRPAMPFLQLLFIRHAQSLGNQTQQMEGQADSALSPLGQTQAQQLGAYLLAHTEPATHIYTSPLQRAHQTATILRSHLVQPAVTGNGAVLPISASALQEGHQGILQGLTWVEATSRYPELAQRLLNSLDWLPIPGAESPAQVRRRAQDFLDYLLEHHQNGDRLWIVSHSWLLQHLVACVLGCDRSWQINIPNTSLFEFWIDCDRWDRTDQTRYNTELWQIHRFNDCLHLNQSWSSSQTD